VSAVTIVDYGVGNLRSLSRAFEVVGTRVSFARDRAGMLRGGPLVLPGVGAFGHCVERVARAGLAQGIVDAVRGGRPLLGICVGMQILFDVGTEFGAHAGLGLLGGSVERIPVKESPDRRQPKLPHIGWAPLDVTERGRSSLFEAVRPGTRQYFLHSYHASPEDRSIIAATTVYGDATICAAVSQENVHGVQFHPEKSGPAGLALLARFLDASAALRT
jgi:imidazole glycerol-phosphate synthase subunit HisH